jgi:response regulator RpfG family c-di-GMP phosphodiesterase
MEKIILFVDNDIFTARIMTKLLGALYTLVIRKTADEAIRDLDMGLKPDIVMSSRVLQGYDGIKFLKRVDNDFPKCFKVLITSEKDPKLLIQYVSESKVDLYLTKPFNSLQLIQILKLGLCKYAEQSKSDANSSNNENKSEISKAKNENLLSDKSSTFKELKILETKYNQEVEKNATLQNDYLKLIVRSISNSINDAENFYFRSHTIEIVEICRTMSTILNFSEEQQRNLLYAALLHNFYLLNAPDLFKVSVISELKPEMKKEFFNHFNKVKGYFSQIKSITQYLNYASMIFEHIDGSGEPNKLSGLSIPKEIQLLVMVNLYHNLVYRVNKDDLTSLKTEGFLIQTRADTIKRHQNAITYFFKNIKWFEHDMFYKFQDFIKKRDIDGLKFNEKDLKVVYDLEKNLNISLDNKIIKNHVNSILFADRTNVIILNSNNEITEEYIEERINIKDLQIGDITTKEIITYEGLQITPPNFKQTESSISKIKNRSEDKLVSDIVFIRREHDSINIDPDEKYV